MLRIIQKTLTEAHHRLGDLLYDVRRGHAIRIVNVRREIVVAYMISPELMERVRKMLDLEIVDDEPQ